MIVMSSFDVTLTSSTEYFWQAVVKDNNGGEAIGQIWNFSKE
jgi:hypothetical protein